MCNRYENRGSVSQIRKLAAWTMKCSYGEMRLCPLNKGRHPSHEIVFIISRGESRLPSGGQLGHLYASISVALNARRMSPPARCEKGDSDKAGISTEEGRSPILRCRHSCAALLRRKYRFEIKRFSKKMLGSQMWQFRANCGDSLDTKSGYPVYGTPRLYQRQNLSKFSFNRNSSFK